ncbi:carboxymuconolactone decarboxylase family protein [Streptomyces sp. NPDC003300]|uniref:carboxymuconolactone decarboxylase family protein n=1 Tax=unclassified Streptomyces TaxID=2593676 RepID=UPI0033BA895F
MTPSTIDRDAGYRLLAEMAGPSTVESTLTGLDSLAPGFPDWIVTALFGGTYQREGLALRDRQIANLAALTAIGGVEPQLDDHVRNSLRIGMSPREIVEVMVHLAPYAGVPRALAGLRVAAGVFEDGAGGTGSADCAGDSGGAGDSGDSGDAGNADDADGTAPGGAR